MLCGVVVCCVVLRLCGLVLCCVMLCCVVSRGVVLRCGTWWFVSVRKALSFPFDRRCLVRVLAGVVLLVDFSFMDYDTHFFFS